MPGRVQIAARGGGGSRPPGLSEKAGRAVAVQRRPVAKARGHGAMAASGTATPQQEVVAQPSGAMRSCDGACGCMAWVCEACGPACAIVGQAWSDGPATVAAISARKARIIRIGGALQPRGRADNPANGHER